MQQTRSSAVEPGPADQALRRNMGSGALGGGQGQEKLLEALLGQ